MVFGTFIIGPVLPAHGVDNPATFEVGSAESGTGSLGGLIESNGSDDWRQLTLDTGGDFFPGEVAVASDTGWGGVDAVIDPATTETLTASCPNINNDDIIEGGTEIDDYPFGVVSGSVPGKVDLCQVYVSYGFQNVGGETHTIAFIGALRRAPAAIER